jgi:RimJ/RimL family protein N-acetyltransferase
MQNIYEMYYWQNSKIRIRAVRPDDSKQDHAEELDSEAWSMFHAEVVPPNDPISHDPKVPSFSIENLHGEYIGHIHFDSINERHGTFSIRVIIWRKFRGSGYGKAAMELLFDYAFNQRRLNKFNVSCLDTNVAAQKMFMALGCRQEGQIREEIYINGRFHDKLLFGLTANEYREYQSQSRNN